MRARPYATGPGTFDNSTVEGVLEYAMAGVPLHIKELPHWKSSLPAINDTSFADGFSDKLRSLASAEFPANVPAGAPDERFFFTVGVGSAPCPANRSCQGPNGSMFAASMNNLSFALPSKVDLLRAHFSGEHRGVYAPDFPFLPPTPFNYTGDPPDNTLVGKGTKVLVLPFNTSVELVMQDTSILGKESHPLHLHGFNFFVVPGERKLRSGEASGRFQPHRSREEHRRRPRRRVGRHQVPRGYPGVWFMHCHLEVHTSWGLKMAWLVLDGKEANQKLPRPPSDLPKC